MRALGLAVALLLVPILAAAQAIEEDLLLAGAALLADGDAEGALELLDRALETDPDPYLIQGYRARALVELGRADEAEEAAHSFGDGASPAEQAEYRELLEQIEALRREQRTTEEEAARQLELAEQDLADGNYERAAASAASALRLHPGLHEAMVVRALALEGLGKTQDAAGLLRAYRDLRGSLPLDERVEPALARLEEPAEPPEDPSEEVGPLAAEPTEAFQGPRLVVGLLGGFEQTVGGPPARSWATAQLRVDVVLSRFGLGLHLQGGIAAQARGGYAYGFFPFEAGATWRIGRHPVAVPYVDAFFMVRYADDARSASGEVLPGIAPTLDVGAGGGGGVEFVLTPRRAVSLRVAPEIHVGAVGAFVFHAGVAVRVGFGRAPTSEGGPS